MHSPRGAGPIADLRAGCRFMEPLKIFLNSCLIFQAGSPDSGGFELAQRRGDQFLHEPADAEERGAQGAAAGVRHQHLLLP